MNTQTETNPNSAESGRRKGNVARLPKPLRDLVNSMLDDGKSYPEIVTALENSTDPKLPHPVTARNICNWFDGGYQDYLRDQAWRERMTINSDRFLELASNDDDASTVTAGGLQAAVIQLCQLMDQLFNPKSGEVDADNFMRATNSLSRLSRSIIRMQQHRHAVALEKAARPDSKEAQAKARADMLDKMDQLFGIRPVKAIDRIFGPLPTSKPVANQPKTTAAPSSLSSSRDGDVRGQSRREEADPSSQPEIQPADASLVESGRDEASASEILNSKSEIPSTNGDQPAQPSVTTTQQVSPAPTTDADGNPIRPPDPIDTRPWNWNELPGDWPVPTAP
jgi:hypothetical protein